MAAAIALLLLVLAGGVGCSWLSNELNKPCPDPDSCECPTNKNPACYPFPGDNPVIFETKRPDAGQGADR